MKLQYEGLSDKALEMLGSDIDKFNNTWTSQRSPRYAIHERIIRPELDLHHEDRLVEVCAGYGNHLPSYIGVDYRGIEPDEARIGPAREMAEACRIHPSKIMCANVERIPIQSNDCNRVLCVNGLHEVKYPETVLSEIDRILVSRGKALIVERMSACFESPEAQERLRRTPEYVPAWFERQGYRTLKKTFLATYHGESFDNSDSPLFRFWMLKAIKR